MITKKQNIKNRSKINTVVRRFFADRLFLEVETPRFVRSPDIEPTLSHFETWCTLIDGSRYDGAMITSPEYSLKKTVSQDIPRIFELARVFRNGESLDDLHNAEFTMLEWYKLGSSFEEGINETQEFVEHIARSFNYDLAPWKIVTVEDLFRDYCGIESLKSPSIKLYQEALNANDLDFNDNDTISDLFHRLLLNLVQPKIDSLPNTVIVAYYPQHEATLAKINQNGLAERFEIFINGVELCNAYGELTDGNEQRLRFENELNERRKLDKTVFPIDDELIEALHKLGEPMFGIALGIDRLLMIVTGAKSIEEVVLFTTNKLFKYGKRIGDQERDGG